MIFQRLLGCPRSSFRCRVTVSGAMPKRAKVEDEVLGAVQNAAGHWEVAVSLLGFACARSV